MLHLNIPDSISSAIEWLSAEWRWPLDAARIFTVG